MLNFFFLWILASLRSELNHQHAAAIDVLRHNHHQELAAAKMELERSMDISRRQVKKNILFFDDFVNANRFECSQVSESYFVITNIFTGYYLMFILNSFIFKGK